MFLGKALYSHSASLHPGVSLGTSEFNAVVTLQWISNPLGESRNPLSRFMLTETRIRSGLMSHLANMQTLPFIHVYV